MIAQQAVDISSIVAPWQGAAAIIAPLLLGAITSVETRRYVKRALVVVLAVVVAVVAVFEDTDISVENLWIQVPVLWATIQAAYVWWSGVISVASDADRSINDVLKPSKGLIR